MLDEKELNSDTDNIIQKTDTGNTDIENTDSADTTETEGENTLTEEICENEPQASDADDDNEGTEYIQNTQDKENNTKKMLVSILEYVEIFAFAVFAVLFLFSFAFRICVVDGDSMNNTLKNGEKLLTRDLFYSPKCGDIVVLHETGDLNKPIVKRVIATEGQTIEIDHDTQTVTVDGEILKEDYVYIMDIGYKLFYGTSKITVPEGYVFVMGDNRLNSKDSRDPNIGCISEQQIMGKVLFRVSGLTLHKVN